MKGQPWQDETVQYLKKGYQDEIDALRAELEQVKNLLLCASEELREYHDDWNEELGAGCIGESCETKKLLDEIAAALAKWDE